MKTKSIKELVELCRSGMCDIFLEGSSIGVVASVAANRGGVSKHISAFLDYNDKNIGDKLEELIKKVQ